MPLPLLGTYPWTPITTFRGEEGHIAFYLESAFADGTKTRADLTPVGSYLFSNGISVDYQHSEHPMLQGYGQGIRNIRAPEVVQSVVGVSAFYTQEGIDLTWLDAGHPEYRIYVDFVDTSIGAGRAADQIPANAQLVQTVIIENAICTSKKIRGVDDQIVTYSLDFAGGQVMLLDYNDMDTPVGGG